MANGIQLNSSTVWGGIATQTFTVVTDGFYTCAVDVGLPYRASGSSLYSSDTTGASALQVLVALNGSTKLTLGSPTPTQPKLSGSVGMACVAGDVITVVPSSAAAADNALNAIKGTINLYQGL